MIRREKVAVMTRLAIEEKNKPRFGFITRNYWFNDYVTTEMWKAFFAITITYALVVLTGLVAYGDSWTVSYHIADVIGLALRLLRIYAAVAVLGILICAMSHVWLYKKAYERQERVKGELRKLSRIYALEDAIQNLSRQEPKEQEN